MSEKFTSLLENIDRRRVLKGGLAAGATALMPGFIGRAKAKTPGLVVFGLSSYPPGFKPWENKGTASTTVKVQRYRGLLGYGADGQPRSELAESWKVLAGDKFQFNLRKNAYFHNGEKVTSADVKATYEAMAAKDSTARLRSRMAAIKMIETPDEHTVVITLEKPDVTFIDIAASPHCGIVSGKALAADPNDFVGAGPYVIANIERGSRIEMEAFDKYYKPGYPKTKKLRFDAFKDENLRVAALEAGDVDIIEYLPWQAMDSVGKNDRLKMDVVNGPFMYVTFNCGKGPFADVRLRQAVGYAIKRSDVIAAAFYGRGNELGGVPLQKSSPFYDEKYQDRWTYDPAKAKALMAEAGHANGFSATLLSTAQYGMHKNTAEVVQQNLAAVGINVQLNLPDWAKRVSLGNSGQYDFSIMGSAGDFNDPDALTKFYDGSLSTSYARSVGFEGKRISELFATARQEADTAKRKAMYAELQQLALDEAPIIPINWRAQGYAYQNYLSGFTNIPGFLTFFSGMVIENIEIG
jgi:peptide/nickel transport system substrate-binding protein